MNLLCFFGLSHYWGYRSPKTGIFLHSWPSGARQKRCWNCGKTEAIK